MAKVFARNSRACAVRQFAAIVISTIAIRLVHAAFVSPRRKHVRRRSSFFGKTGSLALGALVLSLFMEWQEFAS